jgi:hypothetical protein
MRTAFTRLFILAGLLVLSACGRTPTQTTQVSTLAPALPPTQMAVASPTTVPTMAPTAPPTTAPTASLAATAVPSAAPTATALPALAVMDQGFQVWCLPVDALNPATQPSAPPAGARIGAFVDYMKSTRVIIPASACTLAYTFNQPLPEGVSIEAHYFYGGAPWLTATLVPSADNPAVASLSLNQPDVVNPPLWRVNYLFVVKYAGKDLRSDVVSFYKPTARCWEGSLPDPVTLTCPSSDSREPEASKHADVPPSSPDVIK